MGHLRDFILSHVLCVHKIAVRSVFMTIEFKRLKVHLWEKNLFSTITVNDDMFALLVESVFMKIILLFQDITVCLQASFLIS